LDNIAATPVGSDTVTFTSTAAGMLKLEESLAKIPDIDSARVSSIQASIAQGVYQIDPEKIVANLLKLEKDFR
jgi:negative regulator of flagellin synthesis FlgM